MKKTRHQLVGQIAALILATLLPGSVRAQGNVPELVQAVKAYRYGASTAPLDQLTTLVSAARSDAAKRKEAADALASVLTSDAAFEAKQFACRQLVFVAGDAQIPALAALLTDDNLAHYALYALAHINSPAVGETLLTALPKRSGKTEIEILTTLAERGDARAFPAFSERIQAKDSSLREAALSGLAKLADARSAQALRKAYSDDTGAARVQTGHALVECASRLAKRGDVNGAAELYSLLEKTPANPFLESVGLRGMASVNGEKALPALLEALSADGTPRQEAAATVLREMQGKAVSQRLAEATLKMPPQGQRLAVEILGDRGDKSAANAILRLCRSQDDAVRVAALRACRTLGGAPAVPLLLETAASGSVAERAAARESLASMRGADVDLALLGALDTDKTASLAEAIQALGQRASPNIAARLIKVAGSKEPVVSAAALRVIRDRGGLDLLPALIDLLISLPADSRDAALEAVTQIVRREDNPATGESKGARLLLDRLKATSKSADRIALLTALGQVGGSGALSALRKAVGEDQVEVRTAALAALAEWPTDAPMADLLKAAKSLQDDRLRAIALRGYLRMVGNDEQRIPSQTLALYKDAAELATHPAEKRLILSGLSKIPSLQALEYASSLMKDKDVQAEAELALADMGRGTIGAWPDKTREALEPIARSGTSEEARKRAQTVLDSAKRFGDYIVAWEVSPSYQQDGADYKRLFDIAFPPEQEGKADSVAWRPLPVGGTPEQPWLLDLLAQWGGEQKVAYLRTAVWTENARDLSLQMGSDDGLKVWWNGQVVLSHNIARAVVPGQEKVIVHLKPGWNQLLLKVTQNNQGWGAAARFANADGTPVTGLRYALPSTLPER